MIVCFEDRLSFQKEIFFPVYVDQRSNDFPGNQAMSERSLRLKTIEMDFDYLNKKRTIIGRIVNIPRIEEKAE